MSSLPGNPSIAATAPQNPGLKPAPAAQTLQLTQEMQFIQAVYHFMKWKENQEKSKEADTKATSTDDNTGKEDTNIEDKEGEKDENKETSMDVKLEEKDENEDSKTGEKDENEEASMEVEADEEDGNNESKEVEKDEKEEKSMEVEADEKDESKGDEERGTSAEENAEKEDENNEKTQVSERTPTSSTADEKAPTDTAKTPPGNDSAIGESTTGSEKPQATTEDTTEKPETLDPQRYQEAADLLLKLFPEHLGQFAPSITGVRMPPLVSSYFFDLPALQWQLHCTKKELTTSQKRESQGVVEITKLKRKLLASGDSPAPKKARKGAKKAPPEEDIPGLRDAITNDSLVTIVNMFRENTNMLKEKLKAEKRKTKKESNHAKKLAEKAQKTANEAKEALKLIAQAQKNVNKKVPPLAEYKTGSVSFDERIKELRHFKSVRGDCRVPHNLPGLGRWVRKQRELYKAYQEGKRPRNLTVDRIKLLESMGFEWNLKDKLEVPWEQRFKELCEFKEKNGHANVPRNYKEHPQLGEWVHQQRNRNRSQAKGFLEKRKGLLDEIGFEWHRGKTPTSKTFEERLKDCEAWISKHGNLNVPTPKRLTKAEGLLLDEEEKEERNFMKWIDSQRDNYRRYKKGFKSNLDAKKIEKLDSLGMVWSNEKSEAEEKKKASKKRPDPTAEYTFDERIAQLKSIRDKFGDCSSLTSLKRAGYDSKSALYLWMRAQRRKYKFKLAGNDTELTDEQIVRLEAVGFNFEPRKHFKAKKEGKGDEDKDNDKKRKADGDSDDGSERDEFDDDSEEESDNDDEEDEEEEEPDATTVQQIYHPGSWL